MSNKHITLVVTGSVAAVKTFQLAEQLKSAGYETDIIITKAVWEHGFLESPKYKPTDAQLEHLKQTAIDEHDDEKVRAAIARSEKILVCPSSADFISQIANETSALGKLLRHTDKPLYIAPAMNVMMWQHPAVVENVKQLPHAKFLGPVLGKMACGDWGYGRLAEVSDIVSGFESGTQTLFEKARIQNSLLPQEIAAGVKNILLMVHHNKDNQATACAQSLADAGFNVQCMLAPEAMACAEALQSITKNPPIWEHYQRDPQGMEHIRLPEQSDAVVIAPTSEPYLAEMARGASASLCGCAYLATKKPVIIVAKDSPHIDALKAHGATIVPDTGQLQTYLKKKPTTQDVTGKKFLVLAGNPRERVDTFRFYFNDSRPVAQALETAKTLQAQGAEVTVIAPAANKLKLDGVKVIETLPAGKKIESAKDMIEACEHAAKGETFDAVMQLSNISSIACPNPSSTKIQKTDAASRGQLFDVVGNVDVVSHLTKVFPATPTIGYDSSQQWFQHGNVPVTLKDIAERPVQATSTPIAEAAKPLRTSGKLSGKKIVITTSRTEETLTASGDKITNFFSGRQGQAIATAFADMGAEVTLISGPTHLPDVAHPNVKTLHVTSARQMHVTAMQAIENGADAFIGAAAVADFGAEKAAALNLKEGEVHTLELSENPSIVGGAAKHAKRPRVVVSFAAQSPETIQEYALKKFHKLGVDLSIANPIGDSTIAAKDPTRNQVMLIDANGIRPLPEMGKDQVAQAIANEVSMHLLKAKSVTPNDPTDPPASTEMRR